MAITTLKSPGVEITERDLSQYTTAIAGTAVLVTGFAAKGRDYEPIKITTRSSWLQQFGEPSNEAERYFFNAGMEVINQGGELYACKLPYKNDALNQFVGKTYTVNVSKLQELSTVAEYVNINKLSSILAGDYTQFSMSSDTSLSGPFLRAEETLNAFKEFEKTLKNSVKAIPYAYALDSWMDQINIENCEKDNWMWTPVQFIYAKLSALFDLASTFNTNLRNLKDNPEWYKISSFFTNSGVEVPLSVNLSSFNTGAGVSSMIEEFASDLLEHLGGNSNSLAFKTACDPSSGVNINSIEKSYPNFYESKAYRLYDDNKALFNALNMLDFNADDTFFNGQKPYFYCDESKFNLGAYWRAINSYKKVQESIETFNSFDIVSLVNNVIDIDRYLEENSSSLGTVFDDFFNSLGLPPSSADHYTEADNEELKNKLISTGSTDLLAPLGLLLDAFNELFASKEYNELVNNAKKGIYEDTPFAKTVINYYLENTIIPNAEIKTALRNATNLNIFYDEQDRDGISTTEDDRGTVFQLFNGPESSSPELSSIPDVIAATVNQMKYDDMLQYSVEFVKTEKFKELSAIAFLSAGFEDCQKPINALLSDNIVSTLAYSEIKRVDNTVDKYLTIDSKSEVKLIDINTVDGYATGETPVRPNTFTIIDKTRSTLGTAFAKAENGMQKEIVGIIPIVTTAANGLYVQALLETGDTGISKYNAIMSAMTLTQQENGEVVVGPYAIDNSDAAVPFMSDNADDYTVSQMAAASFPSIGFTDDGTMDRENLKKIGIVVVKAFLDPGEGNKVNYDIVEAYVGELDKNAVDPNTGATTFLDNLINSQSEYIEFYSNCFNQTATKELYSKMDLFVVHPQTAGVLGFYDFMTKKNISLTESILKAIPLIWEKNEDINEKQIDIVCDAGVSNIAQYVKSVFNGKAGEYDPASEYATLFKLRSKEDTKTWRAVLDMYDNFCKNIRKDCMFVADGPRPFCLQGNKKIVRPSKPSNTIDGNILPMLKYITGVNTNYGAGYCDWFEKVDEFSGNTFWCPPSIQATGVYLNTDINFDFWSAPAGLNRGIVNAVDIAFNPTIRQSNEIYPKCWNYARSYPNDGIVLEGQRTFQSRPTALDRVNVRRAMLRFERSTFEIARWFVYEDNTVIIRQRLFDALDGFFKEIKGQGGLIDYKVICDETINTPEIIDRGEIRVKIGIKPVKSAEFIICEFNVLRQGGSWIEML